MSDKPMNLSEFLTLKFELQAEYRPPLKAVRMSKATAATFPALPFQSTFETLSGVPIEWDESLDVGEYVPVYVDEFAGKTRVEIAQMVVDEFKEIYGAGRKVLSVEVVENESNSVVLQLDNGTSSKWVGSVAHTILGGKE